MWRRVTVYPVPQAILDSDRHGGLIMARYNQRISHSPFISSVASGSEKIASNKMWQKRT